MKASILCSIILISSFFSFTTSSAQQFPEDVYWSNDFESELTIFASRLRALKEHEGKLFAGGIFKDSQDDPTSMSIIEWDGSNWDISLNWAQCNYCNTRKFVTIDDTLLAIGDYEFVGDSPTTDRTILKYSNSRWVEYTPALRGKVIDAIKKDSILYVIGSELKTVDGAIHGSFTSNVNGNWRDLPDTSNTITISTSQELIIWNDTLIASGANLNTENRNRGIAYWHDNKWNEYNGIFGISGIDLEIYKDKLYAYGDFRIEGNENPIQFARWDGSSWEVLIDSIFTSQPMLLTKSHDYLYLGGESPLNIKKPVSRYHYGFKFLPYFTVARWDGDALKIIQGENSRVFDKVWAMASFRNDLVVGSIVEPFGVEAYNDSLGWYSLIAHNGGTNAPITDLAAYGDKGVVAIGQFNQAGNRTAVGVAIWNGSSWETLGNGFKRLGSSCGRRWGGYLRRRKWYLS